MTKNHNPSYFSIKIPKNIEMKASKMTSIATELDERERAEMKEMRGDDGS